MKPIIELNNLTFKYQRTDARPALEDVSLSINQGEWVAIIGHNGSGKSTLAKTINGLLLPESGSVKVGSKELNEENIWSVRKMVGMVFQNPDNQFVGATVEDDVAFGMENQGVPRDEMIERVDEATSMLDPEGREEVIATIKKIKEENNLTVLSITHDIDEAANANRVLVMRQGQLVDEGTPEKIFSAGPKLVEMGLDLPFPEKLKQSLKQRGVDVPQNYLTEEGMVDWLWTSILKK
jgi:energy-coupling factor transport system ATP-binding protein